MEINNANRPAHAQGPHAPPDQRTATVHNNPDLGRATQIAAQYPHGAPALTVQRQLLDRHAINACIEVDMDDFEVIHPEPGQGLYTAGVATCVAIALRGTDLDNKTVIGLAHASSIGGIGLTAEALAHMAALGVAYCEVYLIGGSISRDPQTTSFDLPNDLLAYFGQAVLEGMHIHLGGVRLGLSESADDDHDPGRFVHDTTGRPEAAAVIITATQVIAAPDDPA